MMTRFSLVARKAILPLSEVLPTLQSYERSKKTKRREIRAVMGTYLRYKPIEELKHWQYCDE